jgi:hypothetical protein
MWSLRVEVIDTVPGVPALLAARRFSGDEAVPVAEPADGIGMC